jgi:very-short-patch-repair endonuclease
MRRQLDSGGDQWSGRFDLRDQELPVVLEVMSEAFHAALSYERDDKVRREKLEADGFVVKEIWDTDVWTRPDLVVKIIELGRREAFSH